MAMRKIRPDIFVGVTEHIEFEVETVLAEVFEIDERRGFPMT